MNEIQPPRKSQWSKAVRWYAVVNWETFETVTTTRNFNEAMRAWEPGTVLGKGMEASCVGDAITQAYKARRIFKKRVKR